nr:Uma2 family endonuclease [Streptomyces sp. SID11385]
MEDSFPGRRTEVVRGALVQERVRTFHRQTLFHVGVALESCPDARWGFVSDAVFPFDADTEFCPDLAVVPRADAEANRLVHAPGSAGLIVEIASPGTRERCHSLKPARYAGVGIPYYVVLDPYRATCVTYAQPGADGYRARDTVPYGSVVALDSSVLGRVRIPTECLPVDSGA